MHVRQVALVARTLEPVVEDLRAVFDLGLPFRDPGVAEFGLHNAVLAVGTTFLEVVSPVTNGTTAGRFLDRRGSDGGYMVLLQTGDLDADRRRLDACGARIVWQIAFDDIATIHLHPRDIGGAIVSLDEPRPPTSWRWGGPGWEAQVRTHVVHGITSVTLGAADVPRMAARWSELLALDVPRSCGHALEMALDPGVLRFVPTDVHGEGIVGIGLAATDPSRALAAARTRGLRSDGSGVEIGGVRFDLE